MAIRIRKAPAQDASLQAWSAASACARAVAMGLPAVAFTEHADYTPWTVPGSGISAHGKGREIRVVQVDPRSVHA